MQEEDSVDLVCVVLSTPLKQTVGMVIRLSLMILTTLKLMISFLKVCMIIPIIATKLKVFLFLSLSLSLTQSLNLWILFIPSQLTTQWSASLKQISCNKLPPLAHLSLLFSTVPALPKSFQVVWQFLKLVVPPVMEQLPRHSSPFLHCWWCSPLASLAYIKLNWTIIINYYYYHNLNNSRLSLFLTPDLHSISLSSHYNIHLSLLLLNLLANAY